MKQWTFSVWAPEIKKMSLHIVTPSERIYPMQKNDRGYFEINVEGISDGATYYYRPDDDIDVPDPASHYQPMGVHDRSAVVDHSLFEWTDSSWRGKPLKDLILYELHVGTFTDEGTFEAIIPRLDDLLDTGINAIEIMPVAQFPGKRNWGYDGVFPYAVQNSYGGPDGLKKLVDACHNKGIVVILDVVYNHLGPEGNYLVKYGPYFSKAHHVPWGDAINFDQKWADGVRDYFLDNINHWICNYHIDGLRLDAIHAIFDSSAIHILDAFNRRTKELHQKVGRNIFLIAESDLNDPRVINHHSVGGYNFDAQWLDDFHHALYVLVHPEGKKRYYDFGETYQLAKAFKDGLVHSGEFVEFRKRKYGYSSAGIDGDNFIVFSQNHDQIGNRVLGERISSLVGKEQLIISAAAIILSPYIPMLFMGEEYGEDAPFLYFIDHSDKDLIEAVHKGREEEFRDFANEGKPVDAQDENTFLKCKLDWSKRSKGPHKEILKWYKDLIHLRKTNPVFHQHQKKLMQVSILAPKCISVYRYLPDLTERVMIFFNFSDQSVDYKFEEEGWKQLMNSSSSSPKSDKLIAPLSFSVYRYGK